MYVIAGYSIYLICSLVTVLYVGRTLHSNGKVYLFSECSSIEMSNSANNFLYVGYCLVNTGFAFFFLQTTNQVDSFTKLLEFILESQGIIFFSLGIMHFINVIFAPKIIMYFLNKRALTFKNNQS